MGVTVLGKFTNVLTVTTIVYCESNRREVSDQYFAFQYDGRRTCTTEDCVRYVTFSEFTDMDNAAAMRTVSASLSDKVSLPMLINVKSEVNCIATMSSVGEAVLGLAVGLLGDPVGRIVGVILGSAEGSRVGRSVGKRVGRSVGAMVGGNEGDSLGAYDGPEGVGVGFMDGFGLGTILGSAVGEEGCAVGSAEGLSVGASVGGSVGDGVGSSEGTAVGSGLGSLSAMIYFLLSLCCVVSWMVLGFWNGPYLKAAFLTTSLLCSAETLIKITRRRAKHSMSTTVPTI